jgi:hypothetical protein
MRIIRGVVDDLFVAFNSNHFSIHETYEEKVMQLPVFLCALRED